MPSKLNSKKNLALNIATILGLSMLMCGNSVKAQDDFSTYLINNQTKLYNQDLDTSRTEIAVLNTSIPYNLRGDFEESDYFTSSMDSIPPPRSNPPPIKLETLPSPSEYAKQNVVKKDEVKIQDNVFTPNPFANNFFSPVQKIEEESFAVQKTVDSNKNVEITQEQPVIEDYNYAVAIDEKVQNAEDEINLEGKSVCEIKFQGLDTVDEEILLAKINTQEGDLFSPQLLQSDLQKLYATGLFTDKMSVEPVLNPDDTVELTFVLEENVIVKNISILGNTVINTNELLPLVSSLKDKPQNLNEINEAIKRINEYYHSKGYILASVSSVDDTVDGDLSFTILEGVINDIKFAGNERTKDYIIKRNIITQPGTVYNEEYLKKDLAKVFSTQIFDEVNREIAPSKEQEGSFDVTVVVKEKSTNSISFGGGIDTGLGAFGSISLREDNFQGKGQKLALTGILGSGILLSDASIKNHMNYQAELSFFEPYFLNADNSLMSKLYFREMGSWNIPLAIEQRIGLKAGIEHKVKDYENLTTSFTAGIEHIDLKEGDFNRISQLYQRHHLNMSERAKSLTGGFFINLTPGIRYRNLDDIENPREGIVAQAQFTEAIGVSNLNHTNGRLSGAVTKFFPVFKKSSFSLTGRAGIKVHGDDMPEIMAYRLGGPYSIRGFRMNGVGTGDSFLMGSAELATPLPFVDKLKWDIVKKMRLTFFVDAGKVFDPTISNVLYDRPLHAITAGIGLRVYIPGVGPISIDYGLPITNPGDYGSKNGYFTFGTGGLNMYNY